MPDVLGVGEGRGVLADSSSRVNPTIWQNASLTAMMRSSDVGEAHRRHVVLECDTETQFHVGARGVAGPATVASRTAATAQETALDLQRGQGEVDGHLAAVAVQQGEVLVAPDEGRLGIAGVVASGGVL